MRTFMLIAAATALMAGSAVAQTATTTTTTKMAGQPKTTMVKKGPVPAAQRTEISKTCSTSADAKNLHGKDRDKFRRACMKGAKST